MNKEFTLYEEAIALKEIGFDEPCFGSWEVEKTNIPTYTHSVTKFYKNSDHPTGKTSAPTYSQAFRWFRENYDIDSFVRRKYKNAVKIGYFFGIDTIKYFKFIDFLSKTYETYEEAELECLKQLIEIVKNKK
jgi:hypothetical protein